MPPSRTSHVVQLPGGPTAPIPVAPVGQSQVHVFHQLGAITGVMSDDFPVMFNGVAYLAYARLSTPGGANSVITVYLNDQSIGTITIVGGAFTGTLALSETVSFDDRDWFNVKVTTVGASCGGTPAGLWVGIYE